MQFLYRSLGVGAADVSGKIFGFFPDTSLPHHRPISAVVTPTNRVIFGTTEPPKPAPTL